jgi:EmrB/QacA subfamily drug resistance transporter
MSENAGFPNPGGSPVHDAATLRRTLIAMTMTTGLFFLAGSVVSVALPAIGRALDAGLSGLQWTVNGYFLTLSVLLIPAGAMGDRYGHRRVMLIGLAIFGSMAIASGLAPTIRWLITTRLLQGVGAALLVPAPLATLRAVYMGAEARGAAIGYWSGWSGVSLIFGPLLGGWLVDVLSWRWAFYFQAPLIAVTVWLIWCCVPETLASEAAGRLDWGGAALAGMAFGGLLFGLIEGPEWGWGSLRVMGSLLIGVVGLALFIVVERRVAHPMVPLQLFRLRNFTGANLNTFAVYGALEALLFFLILYVQNIMDVSALLSGLLFVPISILLLLLSPFFGRMGGRRGSRLLLTAGPVVSALGILLLLGLQPGSDFWLGVMPGITIFSLGLAMTVAPLTSTIMSCVDNVHAGLAAAINQVVARMAGLGAIASLGVVLTLTFNASLATQLENQAPPPQSSPLAGGRVDPSIAAMGLDDLPPEAQEAVRTAYTDGFRWVLFASAALSIVGGLIAWLVIVDPPPVDRQSA